MGISAGDIYIISVLKNFDTFLSIIAIFMLCIAIKFMPSAKEKESMNDEDLRDQVKSVVGAVFIALICIAIKIF